MRRTLIVLALLAGAGAAVGWILTAPQPLSADATAERARDPAQGALVFAAAGCASCHAAPGAEGEARLVLAGGQAFPSDFGTFHAPNISTDPQAGIGGWTHAQFLNAVQAGISPDGAHYYPAFPYTAYAKADPQEMADLWAYMQTLPADATPSKPHDLGLPFSIRRAVGGWKFLYGDRGWVLQGDLSPEVTRGRHLVEALGHCGECHTPRTALGGLDLSRWLAGAPNPSGQGRIPNITPAVLDWSEADIAAYLKSGFTPEFDVVGGHMAEVVENLSSLPDGDLAAIAAYLKAVPAVQ